MQMSRAPYGGVNRRVGGVIYFDNGGGFDRIPPVLRQNFSRYVRLSGPEGMQSPGLNAKTKNTGKRWGTSAILFNGLPTKSVAIEYGKQPRLVESPVCKYITYMCLLRLEMHFIPMLPCSNDVNRHRLITSDIESFL